MNASTWRHRANTVSAVTAVIAGLLIVGPLGAGASTPPADPYPASTEAPLTSDDIDVGASSTTSTATEPSTSVAGEPDTTASTTEPATAPSTAADIASPAGEGGETASTCSATDDYYSVVAGVGSQLIVDTPGMLGNDTYCAEFAPTTDQITISRPQRHGGLGVMTSGPETGRFRYGAGAGFVGRDSFEYQMLNWAPGTPDHLTVVASATVYIDVLAEDCVAVDDFYIASSGDPISGRNVLANDVRCPEFLRADVLDYPSHGTLGISDDGGFTYTPNAGFVGDDSFTYAHAADGGAHVSDEATVSIEVARTRSKRSTISTRSMPARPWSPTLAG